MLEQLLKLVQANAGEAIINNPAIPNEHNDAAIETATSGIFDVLKEQVSSGNIQDIFQMISQGSNSSTANSLSQSGNPIMVMIMNTVGQKLMGKFGLQSGAANGIVAMLIPMVMKQFASKTVDPQDKGFDIGDMMGVLSGGKLGGMDFGGILNQVMGGQAPQQPTAQPAKQDQMGLDDVFGMMKGLLGK